MRRMIRLLKGFSRHMNRINVNAYAASAAFFIFLSLIPIIMLVCSLLPFTPLQKSDLLEAIQAIPAPMVPLMTVLVESVYNSTVGLVSVAAVVTIWSAGKGMMALMRGLNAMNGVIEDRNYFVQRIIASFYTVILLVLMLLSLVLMVFGNTLMRVLGEHFPMLSGILSLMRYLKHIFAWGVLSFFFVLLYAFVPNAPLKIRKQIPGAVFSAVSWNLFSFGFSFYLETFNDMSVYGSLSAIVVVMLWLYFCMYLLLIGAHINRFLCIFSVWRQRRRGL